VIHHHHHHVHHHHHHAPLPDPYVQSDLLWIIGTYRLLTLQYSLYDLINYFRTSTPHQKLFLLSSPRLFLYILQFAQFFQITWCAVIIATWAEIVSMPWYYQPFVVIAAALTLGVLFPVVVYKYAVVMNIGEYTKFNFIQEINNKVLRREQQQHKIDPNTIETHLGFDSSLDIEASGSDGPRHSVSFMENEAEAVVTRKRANSKLQHPSDTATEINLAFAPQQFEGSAGTSSRPASPRRAATSPRGAAASTLRRMTIPAGVAHSPEAAYVETSGSYAAFSRSGPTALQNDSDGYHSDTGASPRQRAAYELPPRRSLDEFRAPTYSRSVIHRNRASSVSAATTSTQNHLHYHHHVFHAPPRRTTTTSSTTAPTYDVNIIRPPS
jgi:hypothetical protein